jgi:hypothetical protein
VHQRDRLARELPAGHLPDFHSGVLEEDAQKLTAGIARSTDNRNIHPATLFMQ